MRTATKVVGSLAASMAALGLLYAVAGADSGPAGGPSGRVEEAQRVVEAEVSPEEAAILEDGTVTTAEFEEAASAYRDCVAAIPGVEIHDSDDGALGPAAFTFSYLPEVAEDVNAAYEGCTSRHFDHVVGEYFRSDDDHSGPDAEDGASHEEQRQLMEEVIEAHLESERERSG